MRLYRLISALFLLIGLMTCNFTANAQKPTFEPGDIIMYAGCGGNVSFYTDKALNKKGEIKKKISKYQTNEIGLLDTLRIKRIINACSIVLSSKGKEYLAVVGLDNDNGKYKDSYLSFYTPADYEMLGKFNSGDVYYDKDVNEYVLTNAGMNLANEANDSKDLFSLSFESSNGYSDVITYAAHIYRIHPKVGSLTGNVFIESLIDFPQWVSQRCGSFSADVNSKYVLKSAVMSDSEGYLPKSKVDALTAKYLGNEVILSKELSSYMGTINGDYVRMVDIKRDERVTFSDRRMYTQYTPCIVKDIHPVFYTTGGAEDAAHLVYRYFATLACTKDNCFTDIDIDLAALTDVILNDEEVVAFQQEIERKRQEEERLVQEREAQRIADEQAAAQRAKELEAEEAAYKAKLVRKYGKKNAELILNGEVIIGFTKQMCIEALGEPDQINTWSAKYNKQQWVYGYSLMLYFTGNVLDDIQTFQ